MNQDEFSQLFEPHIAVLYRVAYQWTLNEAEAEDLVQELASRMLLKIKDLKKKQSNFVHG